MSKPRGQVNYEGYWDDCDGKSLVNGDPLPLWGDQDPRIQQAWEAGAARVEARFAEQFRSVFEAVWTTARPLVISAATVIRSIMEGDNGA